jgi:transposase
MTTEPRSLMDVLGALAEQCRWRLSQDGDYLRSTSFREQIGHACRILRIEMAPPVPYSLIGKLYGVSKGTIQIHNRNWKESGVVIGNPGRMPHLSSNQMQHLIATIIRCHAERKPMRATDIKQYVMSEWGKHISTNTIHHMLARNKEVKSLPAKPMEDKRVMVGIDVISDYFNTLGQKISGTPAAFVFNVDEMGHQVWADAQETVCFVPAWEMAKVIYYPVPRAGKREVF